MDARFEECHPITATWEGGWSDHPADPGGKTMYGVTQQVFHAWLKRTGQPVRPVRGITRPESLQIYHQNYWRPTVGKYRLKPGVDLAVYDASVNSGPGRGIRWLKESVGSSDHSVTVRRICRKRLSFMQSLKIWKTFGRGWSRRVADIEVRGVAMAVAYMSQKARTPKLQAQRKQNEIARREISDARQEAKAKKTAGGVAGAGGGASGVSAADPVFADATTVLVIVGVIAVVVAGVLLLQARAANDREEAYRKGGLA